MYAFNTRSYWIWVGSISKGASQLALVVKNPPANAGDMRHWFDPWVRNVP